MIKQRAGFTIIELTMVIVIIVLLALIVAASYRAVIWRSNDDSKRAIVTQVESGIAQRRNITQNVVPDPDVNSKDRFVKQYQLEDVTDDVAIQFIRDTCIATISDTCSDSVLPQDKVSFYVHEITEGPGKASAAHASVAFWSERSRKYIVHKVAYDLDGQATITDVEFNEGARWSNL